MSIVRARRFLRYVIYARVSTGLESQQDSLENQVAYFENYITENGGERVETYVDEGITGKSMAKRKDLKRLLRDAKNGMFDVVLIKSLSRLSRDTLDSIEIIRKLHSYNVAVFSSREGMIEDEMMLTVIAAINQRQSEDTAYNVSWGIAVKSKAGIFHGTPPYGYNKAKGKLAINEEQAPIVKLIFDLYQKENMGYLAIATHLNEKKTPTSRKNAQKWNDSTVRLMLSNRHYIGDLVHGCEKVDAKDKEFLRQNGYSKRQEINEEDWIVIPNNHEPIITREQYQAVQEKKKFKAEHRYRGKGKKSLFARLACCADCGCGMNYIKASKGYVCSSQHRPRGIECTRHFIKHDALKEAVIADLRQLAGNSIDESSLVNQALRQLKADTRQVSERLDEVNKQLRIIQKKRMELVDKLMQQVLDDETFKMYNENMRADQGNLEQEAKVLESKLSQERDNQEAVRVFEAEVRSFTQLDISDEDILREIFQKLISAVKIYEGGKIEIHYDFKNPMTAGA